MRRLTIDNGIEFYRDGKLIGTIIEDMCEDRSFVIISMKGSFPSDTVNDVLDEMMALVMCGMGITLDLQQVEYLCSGVAHALLNVEMRLEQYDKTMLITHVPEPIYQEFKQNGLYELLDIEVD